MTDPRREPPVAVRWDGGVDGRLLLLDQTLLPHRETEIEIRDIGALVDAIRRLVVRGAPAIGVAAAYGLAVAAARLEEGSSAADSLASIEDAAGRLAASRPTAVNLRWALDRVVREARTARAPDTPTLRREILKSARRIHDEDRDACLAMARHAAPLVRDGGSYLTHCNAGALATGGIGTALGVFHHAATEGKRITVYADETRPLLQGARLTAWELARSGIEVVLNCDSAGATVLGSGRAEAVFVGSDRIARNGDVANKLGTFPLALAAMHACVPFYVVAPTSTIDPDCPTGADIPIEERHGDEVTMGPGGRSAPEGIGVFNPAFDVTPAALVTAIVTEVGLLRPPFIKTIAAALSSR